MNGTVSKPKSAWLPAVEIFATGTHQIGTAQEQEYTTADLDAMVRNFGLTFLRPQPVYQPAAKIGHEADQEILKRSDLPAAGWLKRVWRRGEVLVADIGEVPMQVAEWIAARRYRAVSAEIDLQPPASVVSAYQRLYPGAPLLTGCFLRAASFLGANAQEVKSLMELPMPQVEFKAKVRGRAVVLKLANVTRNGSSTRVFSEVAIMDRQGAIDWLSSKGIDVSGITDAVPDAFLLAVVQALQAAMDTAANPDAGGDGSGGGGGQNMNGQQPGTAPKVVTYKFAENLLAPLTKTFSEQTKAFQARLDAMNRQVEQQANQAKRDMVRMFCEAAAKDGKLSPAEIEVDKATGEPLPTTVFGRLMRADNVATRTFSEGGKQVTKTELQLQMDEINARPARSFRELVPQTGGSANEDARNAAKEFAKRRNAVA